MLFKGHGLTDGAHCAKGMVGVGGTHATSCRCRPLPRSVTTTTPKACRTPVDMCADMCLYMCLNMGTTWHIDTHRCTDMRQHMSKYV